MKNLNDHVKENIIALTVSGILILTFYLVVTKIYLVSQFLQSLFKAASPFIWGFAIAFILIPLRRLIENKVLNKTKIKEKTKRKLSVAIALVIMLLVLTFFFSMVIPQLISSGTLLVSSLDSYASAINELVEKLDLQNNELIISLTRSVESYLRTEVKSILKQVTTTIPTLISYSVSFAKAILNFFVGMIIAVYLLTDTERWKRQANQVIYAVLSKEQANSLIYVAHLTERMFDNFLFGKALDSLIVGVICSFVCGVLNIPYAILIGFIVGVTNMIPVFGPFIGAIPCIFILLLINPAKALEFVIFILILQQIDGNIIGPTILGDSMGLPALWVMFAILMGGAAFGIAGMFLGVPFFSVFYTIIRDVTASKIKEKKVSI